MAQLSIRFLGASADRLVRTVEISNGLHSPASTKNLRVPPIPPHLFPQGRLKTGKSPKVKKGKIGHLHHAGIAEVVFTDTLESGDSRRKYCQVFYDYISRFGYVTAMRSKTEIGDAFADFCCQCWVPLILVRDNAGENVGGPRKVWKFLLGSQKMCGLLQGDLAMGSMIVRQIHPMRDPILSQRHNGWSTWTMLGLLQGGLAMGSIVWGAFPLHCLGSTRPTISRYLYQMLNSTLFWKPNEWQALLSQRVNQRITRRGSGKSFLIRTIGSGKRGQIICWKVIGPLLSDAHHD
jgi:hypothetical protein